MVVTLLGVRKVSYLHTIQLQKRYSFYSGENLSILYLKIQLTLLRVVAGFGVWACLKISCNETKHPTVMYCSSYNAGGGGDDVTGLPR